MEILAFGAWALWNASQENGLLVVPPDEEFDSEALEADTQVEMEHTRSSATAKKIAKHHLLEDPRYYEKLASIHVE